MTDKETKDVIAACKSVSRPGLYIMVFFCLINSCDNQASLSRVEKRLRETTELISNNKE